VTRNDQLDRDRVNRLMMEALDGEISPADKQQLDALLESHPEIRKEYQMMSRVKEVTGAMAYSEPPQEVWDTYWTSVYNKFERGVAWIFLSIGTVVVGAYGAWKWVEAIWGAAEVPIFVRLSILAIAIGLLILAVSVIREKIFTAKRDPYKEIQR
jgi:hypothetical protein